MPQPLIRLFVSSTFSDFRQERSILQNKVFPQLRYFCEESGARFQAVDLRWGVSEEDSKSHKTMDICLSEIARCQKLSPKPNFLILSGDRAGWYPLPNRIPESEWNVLQKYISTNEKLLLDNWYLLDKNALDPEYRLLPIEEPQNWSETEPLLHDILESAAKKAANESKISPDRLLVYTESATYQEIFHGALNPPTNVPAAREHVFACIRTIDPQPNDVKASIYFDGGCSKVHRELKERLNPQNIYHYNASLSNDVECNLLFIKDQFEDFVLQNLKNIITSQLEAIRQLPELDDEALHAATATLLTQGFIGRKKDIKKLFSYLNNDSDQPLLLIGPAGSGKSSLLAKVMTSWKTDHPDTTLILRFLGTTAQTSNARNSMFSLGASLCALMNIPPSSVTDEGSLSSLEGCRAFVQECIKRWPGNKPLIIALDALDQTDESIAGQSWNPFPEALPAKVKFVASVSQDRRSVVFGKTLEHHLEVLPPSDTEAMLVGLLQMSKRTLTMNQKKQVLAAINKPGLPLHVRLAFEHSRKWTSWEKQKKIPQTLEEMVNTYFDDLEKEHDPILVQTVFGYLCNARYGGLEEEELLGMLAWDDEFWSWFLGSTHPAHLADVTRDKHQRIIPIAIWSRLYFDIDPYLVERQVPGGVTMAFFHRLFAQIVKERYGGNSYKLPKKMLSWWQQRLLWKDKNSTIPNGRKTSEEPWLAIQVKQWNDAVVNNLTNFDFLMAKSRAEQTDDILSLMRMFNAVAPQADAEKLLYWEAFFRERIHILRRGKPDWPSYKILLQLAVEHADNSPVTRSAEHWLESGKCTWEWIRRIQRAAEVGTDPCIAVLECDNSLIKGILELASGNLLSWSSNGNINILNQQGDVLNAFILKIKGVEKVFQCFDGTMISWSLDRIFYKWDLNGKILKIHKGHKKTVNGIIQLKENALASWSDDKTIRIWGKNRETLSVLKGHSNFVEGVIERSDGYLISWSANEIILWNQKRKKLRKIDEHTDSIKGVYLINNNGFISWSENEVFIWNDSGEKIDNFSGKMIKGVKVYNTSILLIWTYYCELLIWDYSCDSVDYILQHSESILGALKQSDGSIVSWAADGSIHFFNETGILINKLKAHNGWLDKAANDKDWSQKNTGYFYMNNIDVKVIECDANTLVSWASDRCINIYSSSGSIIMKVNKHVGTINNVIRLSSGRLVSWSDDKTVRIWEKLLKPTSYIDKHKEPVTSIIKLSDGTFASASLDASIILWSKSGNYIRTFKHALAIHGILESIDSTLISWSQDGTIKIWDKNDGLITTCVKTKDLSIDGVIETRDGHLAYWSFYSEEIHIKRKDGKLVNSLIGHKDSILGVIENNDGSFISWSNDNTFRLWSSNGILKNTLSKYFYKGNISGIFITKERNLKQITEDGKIVDWKYEEELKNVLRYLISNNFIYVCQLKDNYKYLLSGKDIVELYAPNNDFVKNINNIDKEYDCFYEYLLTNNNKSNKAEPYYLSASYRICLTLFENDYPKSKVFWQPEFKPEAWFLFPDGRMVASQADGQVCFLQLFKGKDQIPLKITHSEN